MRTSRSPCSPVCFHPPECSHPPLRPSPRLTKDYFQGSSFSKYCTSHNYLNLLKWARSSPFSCPWDRTTFDLALQNSSTDLLDYLLENDCPIITEERYYKKVFTLSTLGWIRTNLPHLSVSPSSVLSGILPTWTFEDLRTFVENNNRGGELVVSFEHVSQASGRSLVRLDSRKDLPF